jgi:hypothetical protein
MIYNKSQLAFLWSAERLFQMSKEVYFWTWTFINVPSSDDAAMEDFDCANTRLQHHFPNMRGLRVCELHRSHGIHFHLLLNIRIPIRRLKEILWGSYMLNRKPRYLDFGRMSVTRCDMETAGYMAKYMTKEYRQSHWFGRRRRWGAMGGYEANKVNDVEFVTDSLRNRKELFGGKRCTYGEIIMIQHYTNLWGQLGDWPSEYKALVLRQSNNWMKQYKELYERVSIETESDMARLQQASTVEIVRKTNFVHAPFTEPTNAARTESALVSGIWDGEAGNEESGNSRMGWNEPF